MKQIQNDSSIPKEQKDLIKKLSSKMVNRPNLNEDGKEKDTQCYDENIQS